MLHIKTLTMHTILSHTQCLLAWIFFSCPFPPRNIYKNKKWIYFVNFANWIKPLIKLVIFFFVIWSIFILIKHLLLNYMKRSVHFYHLWPSKITYHNRFHLKIPYHHLYELYLYFVIDLISEAKMFVLCLFY